MINFESSPSQSDLICANCEYLQIESPACPRRALNVTETTVVLLEDMPIGYEDEVHTHLYDVEFRAKLGQALDGINFLAAILRVKADECATGKLANADNFNPLVTYNPRTLGKIAGLTKYVV